MLPRETESSAQQRSSVVRVATPRPPCRCIANVPLRWSAVQTAPRRKRAAIRVRRGSRFDAAQWAKSAGGSVRREGCIQTAASALVRLNASLAPPPRRSMCHTLANETPFHCNTTATQRVKTSAWTCLTGLPRADCSSADLADVHTWPALACWQRSDSTLPTKVF